VISSTGTSLVPELPFTPRAGDEVRITISGIDGALVNPVVHGKAALQAARRPQRAHALATSPRPPLCAPPRRAAATGTLALPAAQQANDDPDDDADQHVRVPSSPTPAVVADVTLWTVRTKRPMAVTARVEFRDQIRAGGVIPTLGGKGYVLLRAEEIAERRGQRFGGLLGHVMPGADAVAANVVLLA
jgi:hypothetical protein